MTPILPAPELTDLAGDVPSLTEEEYRALLGHPGMPFTTQKSAHVEVRALNFPAA